MWSVAESFGGFRRFGGIVLIFWGFKVIINRYWHLGNEGDTLLRNAARHSPSPAAPDPRWLESSIQHRENLKPRIHFTHLVACLTTGPKPLPKQALHIVRSRASSFKWQYPLLSLRSSDSFLRLLPCFPVTSIPPCIFRSVTRCRRQFRRKMWPIQFAWSSSGKMWYQCFS